jgi:hypothetical protein
MKLWAIAAAALVSLEAAAIACSCVATDDPAQLRTMAAETAKDAVALVEVETIVPFHESKGAGDQMRVLRTIAGRASGEFRVERGPFPSSASCDQLFDKGQRSMVVFYPAIRAGGEAPIYRISSLCTGLLLDRPLFRDEIVRRIRAASLPGERG